MKVSHIFISLLLITVSFLTIPPAQAAPKPQDARGTVMMAETNKPVACA